LRNRAGDWLYPPDCVYAVVHLTRHPFDVAVSYAHHLGISVRDAVAHMGQDETVARSTARLRMPLHERLGSWSGNITSWLDAAPYNVASMRYEDLFENPEASFAQLVKAAGFSVSDSEIARACDASRFDRLQSEETSAGFLERPRSSPAFFRAGKPLSWQGALDDDLRGKLVDDHRAVMARLGYDAEGNSGAAPEWPTSHAIA
jgi:aryl sulfotransferase